MAIDVTGLAIGGVVGAADIAMRKWDVSAARSGNFKTAEDISRIAYVAVGVGAQMMAPRYNRYAVPMAIAGMPLLVGTLYRVFMDTPATAPAAARSRTGYVPPRRAAPANPSSYPAAPMAPQYTHVRLE